MIELNYLRDCLIYFCYKNSPCLISDIIFILIPFSYFKNIYQINKWIFSGKIDAHLLYQNSLVNFCY